MAGEAYVKRYPGGFVDLPTQSTSIDSLFLNLVETELLRLIGADPIDQGVQVWDAALARIKSIKLTNTQIDPAAAIAKSKLAALNIADADVAAGAAIAKSKLAALNIVDADVAAGAAIAYAKLALAGAIVNADIAAAAAIAISKLAGYPADGNKFAAGDGTWKVSSVAPTHLSGMAHATRGSVLVANQAYLIPISGVTAITTLTRLLFGNSVQSGNMDLGIYYSDDEITFTRFFSTGSFAVPAASTAPQVKTIASQTITPVPGRRWYYALAADNATANFFADDGDGSGNGRTGIPFFAKATSFVLPATISSPTVPASPVPVINGLI